MDGKAFIQVFVPISATRSSSSSEHMSVCGTAASAEPCILFLMKKETHDFVLPSPVVFVQVPRVFFRRYGLATSLHLSYPSRVNCASASAASCCHLVRFEVSMCCGISPVFETGSGEMNTVQPPHFLSHSIASLWS